MEQPITQYIRTDCNAAVESGTFYGSTTALLAAFPNFRQVHTVELAPALYEQAAARFAGEPRVRCWLGDSGQRFAQIFDHIEATVEEPQVFVYCDGHYSGGETARGNVASPLYHELETLVEYRHLIRAVLIDDVAVSMNLDNPDSNPLYVEGFPTMGEIYDYLQRINPEFRISIDHETRPLSLLVANV
jgi:hypothetical protein